MKKLLLALFLIFSYSIILRLLTINEIGRTWDEPEFIEQGHEMIGLMSRGEFGDSYFYETYDHPPLIKYMYGLASYLDVSEYNNNGEPIFNYDYTYSRILSAVLFSLGVLFTVLLGWRFFSPLVGVISGIVLAMLPFSLGLSQLVSTESLKIFIYPLVIFSYLLFVNKPSSKRLLLAGILTGIALQVKQSNGLLIFILAGMFALKYYNLKRKEGYTYIKKSLKYSILIFLISGVTFVVIWPQLLFNFPVVYEIHKTLWNVEFTTKIWQITLSVPEVFMGRLMITPIFYYIVYLFISIPILILFLFFIGTIKIFKKFNWLKISFLLWFLVPFVLSIYSWRQHGLRYLIEIYPPLSIIVAVGFDSIISKFTKKESVKLLYFIPIIAYLILVLINIKPYYLDYFNELVGGVNTVYKNKTFQIGWWGQGLREAGLYLVKNAEKESRIGLAISPDHVLLRSSNFKYSEWTNSEQFDYIIVNNYHIIRDGFDDSYIRKNYNLIYEVKVDEATLVYIYKK